MHSSSATLFVISVAWCWCMTHAYAVDKLFKLRGNIAQCRVSCTAKFVVVPATRGHPIKFTYDRRDGRAGVDANSAGCTSKANWKCSMCWDYCESLAVYERTRAQMCADDICLEGCQHACIFMQETPTSSSATPVTDAKIVSSMLAEGAAKLKLAELKPTKTGSVISWTTSQGKLAYPVLGVTVSPVLHPQVIRISSRSRNTG